MIEHVQQFKLLTAPPHRRTVSKNDIQDSIIQGLNITAGLHNFSSIYLLQPGKFLHTGLVGKLSVCTYGDTYNNKKLQSWNLKVIIKIFYCCGPVKIKLQSLN